MICKYITAFLLVSYAIAGTAEEWKQRTIYQLLTDRFATTASPPTKCPDLMKYCGGSFNAILTQLDYIKGMGFDAIWISPVITNLESYQTFNGYHGYWAIDFMGINHHFGTADELKAFVKACQAKGIWVMVDIVANHIGPVEWDYSQIATLNKPEHYHPHCEAYGEDFTFNQWRTELCRVADLPDLDQDHPVVRKYLLDWIEWLVTEFGFDGMRIDTVQNVDKKFWVEFAARAKVYQVGEVLDHRAEYVAGYQSYPDGTPILTALLNYPKYFAVNDVFAHNNKMGLLAGMFADENKYYLDPTVLGSFVDNHDHNRFLCDNPNPVLLQNALTYVILSRGIPIVYYGTEQLLNGCGDPGAREDLWPTKYTQTDMYKFITAIINIRKSNKIWEQVHTELFVADNLYVFARGKLFIAATSNDGKNDVTKNINVKDFGVGTKLCDALDTATCITVAADGTINITLKGGVPRVFVPQKSL